MKIGVLTLPLHTNYGGILQAYALQTVLERMGHCVEVLNLPQIKTLPSKWPIVFAKRLVKKVIFHKKCFIFAEFRHNKYYPLLSKNTQQFIDSYVNQRMIWSLNEVKEKDYDAIVVGSDQIWNPSCFRSMWNADMETAFLGFTEKWNIKRVAYAASFGKDEWMYSKEETEKCIELAKKFVCLSVREKSGVDLCLNQLKVSADIVPDPTLLLGKDFYIDLVKKAKVKKSSGELLCYILDESAEKNELIRAVARDRNLVPFRVNSKIEDAFASIEERVQPSVEQWLQGFCDAKYVVTDSFHACVFSIIFGKPFIVYGNKMRGLTRFTSLLSFFGIESNLITSLSEYSKDKVGLIAPIELVNHFRNKGSDFLKKGLS